MRIGAAYIRVSTDDQLDISPESQLDEDPSDMQNRMIF